MSFTGDFEFKKVDFDKKRTVNNSDRVSVKDDRLTIPSALVDIVGFEPGGRVDLLQSGAVFALEKSPVGVFKLRKVSKESGILMISSIHLCRHIRTVTHEDCRMKAMADGNRIIFYKEDEKPNKE